MKKLFLILVSCIAFTAVKAQWVVSVAGVLETPGFNDGPALSSRFFNPHGIAVSPSGVIFIADRYNHTIRTYDPVLGAVGTLAGQPGVTGDTDGVGSLARFHEPWDIAVAPNGDLYVADTKNNKIRRIETNGNVTTVAGTGNFGTTDGPGSVATFGEPSGIEVGADGIVYVADHNTHIIRKVEPNGNVSTLAGFPYIPGDADGTGNGAQFWRPYGITLDNQGNLLVADEWNHKIRRVTPGGVVTTVAGLGEAGLTDGESDEARFYFPWDVAVDHEDNIYVADGYNYVIRKIAPDGLVTSFAGKPQTAGGQDGVGADASFSGATALDFSATDTVIYVGDAYNHLIRKLHLDGAPTSTVSLNIEVGSTQMCEAESVAFSTFPDYYPVYSFFLNDTMVQTGSNPNFSMNNLPPGTFEFHVQALADGDLVNSNTVIITVNEAPEPSISAVGPLTFYEGDSVILVANGTGDFLWSNGSSLQAISVSESGAYFVEEDNGECVGISEGVQVEVIPLPDTITILVDGDGQICPGETLRLTSSSLLGNQWLKDGWVINGALSNTLEVSEPGFYQVQVTDQDTGITAISEGQEVTLAPEPDFDFDASPRQALVEEEIEFFSSGTDSPISFSWNFGDEFSPENTSDLDVPTHAYASVGLYTIELFATDENECEYSILKENFIQIIEEGTNPPPPPPPPGTSSEGTLFLPTAFTPNGDGANDIFRVRGTVTGEFFLAVFNQWGEQLFVSENASLGWDGTVNGSEVSIGNYTYFLQAETPDGKKQLSGNITLLR